MIKQHLLFLLLKIKSILRMTPKLVLSTVIFSVLIFVIGFCGNKALSGDGEFIRFKVGTVMPEGDHDVEVGFSIIQNMESVDALCEFEVMEYDDAMKQLSNNQLCAVICIPEHFVDDLMNGVNTPATLYIPENPGTESIVILSLMDAGAKALSYAESGIYSVEAYMLENDFSYEDITATTDDLFNFYVSYALNRGSYFNEQELSSTGSSSIVYYISSGIVLILLLTSISMSVSFKRNKNVQEFLRSRRISEGFTAISELIGVSVAMILLFGSIILIGSFTFMSTYIELGFTGFIVLTLVILSAMSFIMLLSSISDNSLVITLLILLISAIIMYAGGRIVPLAYLPDGIAAISTYLPSYNWCALMESAFAGKISTVPLIYTSVFTVVSSALSIIIRILRRRQNV